MPNLHIHPMHNRPMQTRPARRGMSGRTLAGVAVAGALIGLWTSPGRAHADQIEEADTSVGHVRVTYVEPIGRAALYVELNNGATYQLRPCRLEDGSGQGRSGCYWDANGRGNGIGRSFAVLPGRTFVYSQMIGDAR